MRIIHSDNLMLRRYGELKVSTGRRHFNGMIRNNWKVCEFSERDIAKFEAPLNIKPLGSKKANRRFIETCDNYKPDLIMIGHSDLLTNKTLKEIKRLLPQTKLIYRNLDPLWRKRNIEMIHHRTEVIDALFVTTSGDPLKQFLKKGMTAAFIPNATDPGMDDQNNSEKHSFDRDLVFIGRGNKSDDRYKFLQAIDQSPSIVDQLKFESYGLYGNPGVYGHAFEKVIATSKMGLNLNRFEGWPLYSSDRIAQLIGNGILTFLWDKGEMRRLLTDEHVVYFSDLEDLINKVISFQSDDAMRRETASKGRAFYHRHFSGQRVTRFMVETAFGMNYSEDYIWQDQVFRK